MDNSLTWSSSALVRGPWFTQIGVTMKWTLSFVALGIEDQFQLDLLTVEHGHCFLTCGPQTLGILIGSSHPTAAAY